MSYIEKKLDALVQQYSVGRRCRICGCKATEVHHVIPRANLLLRYDVTNLMPVCRECHMKIHDKGLNLEKYFQPAEWKYLQLRKNIILKNYLMDINFGKDDFFEECKILLKKELRNE